MVSICQCPGTAVGISYSDYVVQLVADLPGLLDYVEIPFELLVHGPAAIEIRECIPIVLHCASLSLAGDVDPDAQLVKELKHWILESETPWLGEHIAYVRTDGVWREIAEHSALSGLRPPGSLKKVFSDGPDVKVPFNVGYTVSPQLSVPILERVAKAAEKWSAELGLPILLENGPIYFKMPGSTLSQVEFIQALCSRATGAGLLLDLSHLAITCSNLKLDPIATLRMLPLQHVVEVHLSGAREEKGLTWDDHSAPAPAMVFQLLRCLLAISQPRAVTLEYNWDANFPREILCRDVARVRELLAETVQSSR
jgi:hypothetical protein